jgi:hypothetical protein
MGGEQPGLEGLGQKTHVQKVVGSNPAINWMDVSNYIKENLK